MLESPEKSSVTPQPYFNIYPKFLKIKKEKKERWLCYVYLLQTTNEGNVVRKNARWTMAITKSSLTHYYSDTSS